MNGNFVCRIKIILKKKKTKARNYTAGKRPRLPMATKHEQSMIKRNERVGRNFKFNKDLQEEMGMESDINFVRG